MYAWLGAAGKLRLMTLPGHPDLQSIRLRLAGTLAPLSGIDTDPFARASGHPVALVMQAERRAGDIDASPRVWFWTSMTDPQSSSGSSRAARSLGRRAGGRHRIPRRAPAPVAVPGGEVGDGHPPQALAGLVEGGQLLPLGVGDAQGRQGRAAGGLAAAVEVQVRPAARDAQDLDDPAVVGGDPLALGCDRSSPPGRCRRPGSSGSSPRRRRAAGRRSPPSPRPPSPRRR